ncbi:hypothetical protein GPX89_30775 [Nocardia sp. ET3-3]|uniref:Uncharacterized protein n=1 Tax=Nocardia terrae TaxID=2675851 RepID=A0A7K1V554_9NOCA|nr:hypothetical protein [Nocardia terrae]MVU81612.1 hypothetical protein [Nocardia terrae]
MPSSISADLDKRLTGNITSAVLGMMEESEESAEVAISLRHGIDVKLSTDQRSEVAPSDELKSAVRELAAAHRQRRTSLTGAKFSFQRGPGYLASDGFYTYRWYRMVGLLLRNAVPLTRAIVRTRLARIKSRRPQTH